MTYKTRIIHSPMNRYYRLEAKDHWWSRWEEVQEDGYRENGSSPSNFGPFYTQLELLLKYQNRADELVEETVVYTRKG